MPGYSGGTAAADLARLRRMVGELETGDYDDSLLIEMMSSYPLPDVAGEWPLLTTGSANTAWVGTYDLAAAAADIWEEKAVAFVGNFDFTADGATFNKSQVTAAYERQARKWRSRRAIGTHTLVSYPPGTALNDSWIANLAERDYP